MIENNDERVLVLAALPVDAHFVSVIAAEAGIQAQPCRDMGELCARIRDGAGVAVVDQLALSRAGFDELADALREQPAWSDIQVIIVAAADAELRSEEALDATASLGNVVVLQRPLPVATMVTALGTALAARRRQYSMRRAIQDLRESEGRFRALVSASSEVLYRMNPDWSEMRWLGGGSFLADTHEPSRDWLQKYIRLDDQPGVTAAINAAIRSRSTFELEHRVRRVNGSLGWTHSRAIPVLDESGHIVEWFGAASDITGRKEAEEAVRESEKHFHELADSMPQLVWVLDETGSIIYVNRQWFEQFGTPVEHSYGDRWLQVVHPEDREGTLSALRRSIGTGAPYQVEHRARAASGEYRWFLSRAVPIRDQQGRITRWFGTSTDIEDTKRAEERLRQSQRLESVGLLAGGIAHDFNNLLTGIMGNASLLQNQVGPGAAQQLESIIGAAERAAHLTRQLLAYSGKGQFVVRELDISEVVDRVAELVRSSIPKGVNLTVEVSPRLPRVRMDPSQLEQILVNLVLNAGEAVGEGKSGRIAVAASATDIEKPFVDTRGEEVPAGRYILIEVSDNGTGIDDRVKSKIFDPFFTTKFMGRGLGLAAVAGILRSLKGGITVESTPGAGSSFHVLLPVGQPAQKEAETRAGAEGRSTVLVVDDEPAVRDFIAALLRQLGHRVLTASDGQDALRVCEAEIWEIDVAIVDVAMPQMGANELVPALKARQPKMKVLLTSAYGQQVAAQLCSEYPGSAFIQKPYTAQQLTLALDELLRAGGQEGGNRAQTPSAGHR